MEDKPKINLLIDEKEVIVEEGMTILEAAKENNIDIPTLCHHPALTNWGGCRMCMVEVDGSPRLVASCVTPVRAGMEVVTSNDRIIEHRRTILEFIFAERNHNCMFCPMSGDCELQKMAYDLQMDHLTVSFSFKAFPSDITSEYMGFDHNRCILCGRCVRACHEIAGADVLNFQNRGPRSLIGFDLNETRDHSTCFSCGVCLQVCPTGAIFNRYRTHYAVKGHNQPRSLLETVCSRCGLLCPVSTTVCDNILLKVEGQFGLSNGRPDRGQLCYKGRFQVFKTDGQRLHQPMVRQPDGSWSPGDPEKVFSLVAEKLKGISDKNGKQALFGIVSSSASNETLLTFRDLCRDGIQVGYMDTLDGQYYRAAAALWNNEVKGVRETSWKSIQRADYILMVGGNPYRSQPLIANLIREAIKEKTARVRIINPTNGSDTMCFPDPDLKLEQEKLPLLLKAFMIQAGHLLKQKTNPEKKGEDVSGEGRSILERLNLLPEAVITFDLMVKEFKDSRDPLIIIGDDITGMGDPSGVEYALNLSHLKMDSSGQRSGLIILKPFGNSAGAWSLGLPSVKSPGRATGYKGGLLLLVDESSCDHPLIIQNGGLDILVVVAPFVSEKLKKKAHVLIPSPWSMEEEGTYCSLNGEEITRHRPVLKAPDGVQDSWLTLLSLGQKIGFKPEYKQFEELSTDVKKELDKRS